MSHKGDGLSAVVRRRKTFPLPNGKELEISQLTLRDVAALREQACSDYKRNLIETYTRNSDLLPEDQRQSAIADAFKRAEAITADDLPAKKAWIPKVTADGTPCQHTGERYFHIHAKVWIDHGGPILEEKDVDYATWWSSFTNIGRLHTLWLSVRHCPGQQEMTKDELLALIADDSVLDSAASEIGDLSEPRLGKKGEPPKA